MKTPNKNIFQNKLNELKANKEKLYAQMKEQASDPKQLLIMSNKQKSWAKLIWKYLKTMNKIKKSEYEAAITRQEEIADLITNLTPQSDPLIQELNELSKITEVYEEIHFPMEAGNIMGENEIKNLTCYNSFDKRFIKKRMYPEHILSVVFHYSIDILKDTEVLEKYYSREGMVDFLKNQHDWLKMGANRELYFNSIGVKWKGITQQLGEIGMIKQYGNYGE